MHELYGNIPTLITCFEMMMTMMMTMIIDDAAVAAAV